MGRKKKFIEKTKATTFHLVHRDAEDAEANPDGGDFELVSAEEMFRRKVAAAAAANSRHPLAFLYEEEKDMVQNEEQREEILNLGLPDDGYNYTQHLRAVNVRRSAAMTAAEPTKEIARTNNEEEEVSEVNEVEGFIPPDDDVAFVDARGLAVKQAVQAEEEADGLRSDVSAFSRMVRHSEKLAKRSAIREMNEMMRALEEYDDPAVAAEPESGDEEDAAPCRAEPILGDGDLLDDFVLSASAAEDAGPSGAASGAAAATNLDGLPEDPEEWDFDSDVSDGTEYSEEEGDAEDGAPELTGLEAPSRRGPASIADSFWRPAREDRTDALTVIDERFIHKMDLEYNDDEIGSLEDDEEATRGCGLADGDTRIHDAIQDFLANYRKGNLVAELPVAWQLSDLSKEQIEQLDDELVARLKAKEAYYRQQETEARNPGAEDRAALMMYDPRPKERWDCESVLSLRSNLTNHPATIQDDAPVRRCRGIGGADNRAQLQFSAKTGLPLGVPGITVPKKIVEDGDEGSDEDEEAVLNLGVARERGESKEDKKARKAAVKANRRAARESKKELKQMYTKEQVKAQKHATTNKTANASVMYIP